MDVGGAAHVPVKVRDDSELPAQSVHQLNARRQQAWQTKGGDADHRSQRLQDIAHRVGSSPSCLGQF